MYAIAPTNQSPRFAAYAQPAYICPQHNTTHMKRILVIGSTGQIGSELTPRLRDLYGTDNVVAGYIEGAKLPADFLESGPSAPCDVTDPASLSAVIAERRIDTIFNLAALLSVVAESKPRLAWRIGVDGLWNVLEVARQYQCALFTPSSIGAFGPGTPPQLTPQDTVQRPTTIYGISKVTSELLCDYYHLRYGLDTRGLRYPGLISYVAPPGGGTTDYAVDIYHSASSGQAFHCPIAAGTYMDLMYMPDAIDACIRLMEADPARLRHRNSFNVTAISADPEALRAEILTRIPSFQMDYCIDPVKQAIAESWPDRLDDSCAREEWGWKPQYSLSAMTDDMLRRLASPGL